MAEVKKAVEKIVDKVVGIVEVELKDAKEGVHTIFTSAGIAEFENGAAKVKDAVAQELKQLGLIK